LGLGAPYGLETTNRDYPDPEDRFKVLINYSEPESLVITDQLRHLTVSIPYFVVNTPNFNAGSWYHRYLYTCEVLETQPILRCHSISSSSQAKDPSVWKRIKSLIGKMLDKRKPDEDDGTCQLFGTQVDRSKFPSLQRNAASRKDKGRRMPKPIVVTVNINGHPCRALLDSGSLGDFMSSTLVDQLKLNRRLLEKPLTVQLAILGSRTRVNSFTEAWLQYQGIDEIRTFDIINVSSYDLILGTPWLWQHQVCLGFNKARVVIGSDEPLPFTKGADTKLLVSALYGDDEEVEQARQLLRDAAVPLCRTVAETELSPLWAINHKIPLIDEKKTYSWRSSRCPEAFRPQWAEKRDAYIKSGRWITTAASNMIPMMFILKPNKGDGPPKLRTVFNLRERNKNTQRMTSPLPDMDGVLRHIAVHPWRSILDLQASFEQIRVDPEHVARNAATTPDGNFLSRVVMQGDCNAPATQQTLMVHLFSPYMGRFLDVYLDDIIIYSDTLKDHIDHVKLVFEILKRERMYLSKDKLQFLPDQLHVLGHIVGPNGIRMDAEKVDKVVNWKTPTNRDLLWVVNGTGNPRVSPAVPVPVPVKPVRATIGSGAEAS
jgi:hypothetical protein